MDKRRSQGWPLGWIGASVMVVAAVGAALSLSGCNLYGGIDHPGGDAQLISAARACLDAGDYQCALNDYEQLSSASSDVQNSESAYAVFAQEGASMEAFASGFGNGKNADAGSGFTAMANSIIAKVIPGAAARTAIYDAFIKYQGITDNPQLSALVEFLGANAFVAEVLAEMANGGSTLTCAEVESASNPVTTCAVGGPLACTNGTWNTGSCPATPYTSAQAEASTPSLDMINAALLNIQDGVKRLGGSGNLTSVFNNAFTFTVNGTQYSLSAASACSGLNSGPFPTATPPAFIDAIVALGIGGC